MKIDIKESEDGKTITTLEEIWFEYEGMLMCVPKGYVSDGASVPRFLWRLLSPCIDPQTLVPSIIHDFLYEWELGTRYDADLFYVAALMHNGYPEWKCILTFAGVRLFGGSHYGSR